MDTRAGWRVRQENPRRDGSPARAEETARFEAGDVAGGTADRAGACSFWGMAFAGRPRRSYDLWARSLWIVARRAVRDFLAAVTVGAPIATAIKAARAGFSHSIVIPINS